MSATDRLRCRERDATQVTQGLLQQYPNLADGTVKSFILWNPANRG